jgi:aconitate hydratase 2/2-methylisocitrate dehydratase
MGAGANVFLASAELASVCSVLGRIPSYAEYMSYMHGLESQAEDTYRYLNFDQIDSYIKEAGKAAAQG